MFKICLSLLAAGALLAPPAQAQEKIRLGFIAAQSGAFGVIGAEQKRGLEVALEHLGGRLGGTEVEVFSADSKSNPSAATQEASKLIDKDRVQIVTGGTGSNEVMAIVKPITSSGAFFIHSNGGPSPLAGKECSPNYFNVAFQNDQWSAGMGEYMNKHAVRRAYFIGMDYQAGWDHIAGAIRSFKGDVTKVFTPQGQLDFSAEFARIRAANPDGVFAFYPGTAGVAFVKQYSQSGLSKTVPLYANNGLMDSQLFTAMGDAAVGVVFSAHYNPELDNPANKRFVADYRKKFGRTPTTFASQSYDAMVLIDGVVRQLKGRVDNKDALRSALRKAQFQSVRGPFKFNVNHMPIQNIYVQRVEKREGGELYARLLGVAAEQLKDVYFQDCPMKW